MYSVCHLVSLRNIFELQDKSFCCRKIARCLAQFHSVDVDMLPMVNRHGKPATIPKTKFIDRVIGQLDGMLALDLDGDTKAM